MASKVDSRYDLLLKNVPIYLKKNKKHRLIAEIDLIGRKGDDFDIFEVKCSNRITKAKHQLTKIKKYLEPDAKVRNKFFFCGESDSLMLCE